MTLHYAKILDTTMRKSWEEATKQGVFRINIENKRAVKIELTILRMKISLNGNIYDII